MSQKIKDAILILLIILCGVVSLNDVSRISNRRAQQQRIKTVRRPTNRELSI